MSALPPPQTRQRSYSALPALVAAIAALLVYAVTLGGTFIYDDIFIVLTDPRISHPSQWGKFWTQGYFAGGLDDLYRPLVSMSYALQYQISHDHAFAYHLVNWLLHAAVAATVAEFTRRRAGTMAALAAGLLFAVHPVHVEAVAGIVGRAELSCALGMLGALVLLERRPLTAARVASIMGCLVLAVLSKEQGVLLPILLLLFAVLLWRQPGDPPAVAQEKSNFRGLALAVIWAMAAYLIAREQFLRFEWNRSFLDWGIQPMVDSAGRNRLLMPLVLLGHYARLLIFPTHLSLDYGANVIGSVVHFTDPYLWLGIATVAVWIIATTAAAWRRCPFALFCLLSLALLYGVVGNILTIIGVNLAERLIYLPSAFFLMLVALALAQLPRAWFAFVLSAAVIAGSVRTITYAQQWNNRLALYQSALAQQPNSSQLHLLLTIEYLNHNDTRDALTIIRQATEKFPNYYSVWAERGTVEDRAGQLDDAARSLRRAFDLSPSMAVGELQQKVEHEQAARRQNHHPATTRSQTPQKIPT